MKKLLLLGLFFQTFNLTAQYYSQYEQDKFINEHFVKNKRRGFFVDIGAHDGKTYSNTYFFEKELGWKGICFEPLSKPFEKLVALRTASICLNVCVSPISGTLEFIEAEGYSEMLSGIVSSYHPLHLERLKREVIQYGGDYRIIEVPSVRFNDVMSKFDVFNIDFLSIDTEGSELEILKSINFELYIIKIIAVENNYKISKIRQFLESKGYQFVIHQGDEIYIKN